MQFTRLNSKSLLDLMISLAIVMWLTKILNSIIELEQIPPSLKSGITIPVYKGGGKDPCEGSRGGFRSHRCNNRHGELS